MAQTTPDASLDAEIELKKRARRRLVGAAALALLAAVVLPMVMDHQPKPVSQDIEIRIPSQEGGGFVSRILPGKRTAPPLPPPAPAQTAVAEAAKEVTAGAPKAGAPAAEAKPQPEPARTAAVATPAEAEAATPPKADKPAEKTKPAPAHGAKAEEARAAAALGGGEQWIVQLGAYKEVGHVKMLLAKIKQLKLPVYTETLDSSAGPRTRVRAGPFASREAAEKAKARIKSIGVDGHLAQK